MTTFYGNNSDWERLFDGQSVSLTTGNPVPVKHVHSKTRETDSYGEYMQGDEDVFVIFELNGKFYKKSGYQDSYGGSTWDGPVVEVTPITKTIQVWS